MAFINLRKKLNNKISKIILVILLCNNISCTFAETTRTDNTVNKNIILDTGSAKKPEIKISGPKKIDGTLGLSDMERIQKAAKIQKEMDVADIRNLWEASVERNTVIKFAVKKLAMPADQRRIHSSLMARSISTLIGGVSILPGLFGFDSVTSTASSVTGSLVGRIIENKSRPKELPLTDTELIHLADLIYSLQDRIIKNYYDYKSSIEALRVCRQNLFLQNKNYSEALNSDSSIAKIAYSSQYDKELLNELRLKQQIKLYRLELERLAGTDAVSNLTLTKVTNLNVDTIKTEEKPKEIIPANKNSTGEAKK